MNIWFILIYIVLHTKLCAAFPWDDGKGIDWLGNIDGPEEMIDGATSTCYASVIAGDPFGVVTQSSLVIAKVALSLLSFLSGLQQFVNYLEQQGNTFSGGHMGLSTSLGRWRMLNRSYIECN